MKRKIAVSALLVATLLSCNRTQTTTIEGQVRTFGTEDPIKHPPVVVELIERRSGGGGLIGGSAFDVLDSVRTDENGNFSVTADLTKNGDYFLAIQERSIKGHGYIRRSYYPTVPQLETFRIKEIGGSQTMNIYMDATGWVKFHIKNINPQPEDEFNYNFLGGLRGTFFGSVDEKMIVDFVGNTSHNYAYRVTKNGVQTVFNEQVFPIAFDTIQVDIHY